ncbi:hypothetical protein NE237_020842 [Protea cynaroides]|uniref:Uncharacterized protein n=1 Tax=Protea cynaroides TaxID=273540 RepID=A0A9Q0K2Y8_9MAGN|nr:hypothetical protein NE237_020842 [Protea cynaroides]
MNDLLQGLASMKIISDPEKFDIEKAMSSLSLTVSSSSTDHDLLSVVNMMKYLKLKKGQDDRRRVGSSRAKRKTARRSTPTSLMISPLKKRTSSDYLMISPLQKRSSSDYEKKQTHKDIDSQLRVLILFRKQILVSTSKTMDQSYISLQVFLGLLTLLMPIVISTLQEMRGRESVCII